MINDNFPIYVTVCTKCGAIVAILGADKEWQTFPVIKRENMKILVKSFDKPKYFNEIKEKFSVYPFANLPLCNSCLSTILREISIYSSILFNSSKLLKKILNETSLSLIKYRIDELLKNSPKTPKDLKNKKKIKNFIEEIPEQKECKRIIPQSAEVPTFIVSMKKHVQQGSLISFTCFRIATYGHYGVINGCRLGSFEYHPNTLKETNIGLTFLAQLIKHITNCIVIPGDEIIFNPEPVLVSNNKTYVLQVPEKSWSNKAADDFNAANDEMFRLCDDIISFGSAMGYGYFPPIFCIDTKNRTIGDVSYVYNPKDLTNWSISMKLLLANLKAEQFRSLRMFLCL